MTTSDEFYATRRMYLYEIAYVDGRRETVQAHSMSFSGGAMAAMFSFGLGGNVKPEARTVNFYRHPVGVILIVREEDTTSIRVLDLDPAEQP